MAHLTRSQILARKVGTEEVTLDGGATVTVRGITRKQAETIQAAEEGVVRDATMISLGLVSPALSVDDVATWFESAPAGDAKTLSAAIMRLSGMTDEAGKDATKSVPG
jgi:hypothetical protein